MADDRLTVEELKALFGGEMPWEAYSLIWEGDGSKTIGQVRAELTEMAKGWKARRADGMVERVAAALYAHGWVGDWPPREPVDLNMDAEWFRGAARAAIAAMREPTEEMVTATCVDESGLMRLARTVAAGVWRSMVNAALKP